MARPISYSVADGRRVRVVESLPQIVDGFIQWNGERREVRDVHNVRSGTQIELIEKPPIFRNYLGQSVWER